MTEIAVRGEYITLGQLIKLTGAAGTGGDVKRFLAETAVSVNGEPENRRGRKLRPGDSMQLPGLGEIRLVAQESVSSASKS